MIFWVWTLAVLGIVLVCGAFVAAILTMAKDAGSDQEQDEEDWWV
jgi:hypothetical protein